MTKLNQIIAIEKGVKSRVFGLVSNLHKINQKPELFNGFTKVYSPKFENGETFPPERKLVAQTVESILSQYVEAESDLINLTFRKDSANRVANADVKVNGKVVITEAPVPFLLFLEKQLTDARNFIKALPVLDSAEVWQLDPTTGLLRTEATYTNRTQKVPDVLVKAPATDKHPAQTEVVIKDIITGTWDTTKFSGAIPMPRKEILLKRVETLLIAVKQAREEANAYEEKESAVSIGEEIFSYILGQ